MWHAAFFWGQALVFTDPFAVSLRCQREPKNRKDTLAATPAAPQAAQLLHSILLWLKQDSITRPYLDEPNNLRRKRAQFQRLKTNAKAGRDLQTLLNALDYAYQAAVDFDLVFKNYAVFNPT